MVQMFFHQQKSLKNDFESKTVAGHNINWHCFFIYLPVFFRISHHCLELSVREI